MDNHSQIIITLIKPNNNQQNLFTFTTTHLLLLTHHLLSLLLITIISLYIQTILSFNTVIYNSSIITTDDESHLISQWIHPKAKINYSLLYKASIDGDSSIKFHELCDNKGPTLTLVSTTEGWKFGGYTEIPWELNSSPSGWINSSKHKSFIFSLNLRKLYPSKDNYSHIFSTQLRGPSFGGGFDFSIVNHSLHKPSSCYSPVSFTNLNSQNEFNGGNYSFLANEVEVYSVKII